VILSGLGVQAVCKNWNSPLPVARLVKIMKRATVNNNKATRLQQGNKTTMQQGNKAATRQQCNKATRQQCNKATRQQGKKVKIKKPATISGAFQMRSERATASGTLPFVYLKFYVFHSYF
jgi:hypothetical protein